MQLSSPVQPPKQRSPCRPVAVVHRRFQAGAAPALRASRQGAGVSRCCWLGFTHLWGRQGWANVSGTRQQLLWVDAGAEAPLGGAAGGGPSPGAASAAGWLEA
jgi:hypothetical protein